jgi:hypothetical protein
MRTIRLPKSVSSIGQFCDWVENVAKLFENGGESESPWFRGSGCQDHELLPGLYRTKEGRAHGAEDELRYEFTRRGRPLVGNPAPRDDWEWYFLMQHYRAPTRLLDWTDSALVALYFAVTSWDGRPFKNQRKPLPTVWALNPFRLNRHTKWDGAVGTSWPGLKRYLPKPYMGRGLPKLPIAIDPDFVATRMLVQHSRFTLHGSDQRSLNNLIRPLSLKDALLCVSLDFKQAEIDFHLQQLTTLGIMETSVFPDLEGLARELRLEYGLNVGRTAQ